jgi:hypothetical protein
MDVTKGAQEMSQAVTVAEVTMETTKTKKKSKPAYL